MALSSSQRVTLIKEIANRLAPESWSLIDLTLTQFGVHITDDWSGGNSQSYVLKMLEKTSDQTLIELAHHLGFSLDVPATSYIEPAFWRKGMFRLFISHLATQRKVAAQLQESLLRYGISSFVAHNDIEPTSEWQNQIEIALSTCEALVALLHDGFHESKWTDQEIGFAMGRSIPVCAVQFGEAPYGFIGRFQAFNGRDEESRELAKQIFDAYRKNKQTKRRMVEVMVSLFEDSNSFAEAKERIGNLESLGILEPSFTKRIAAAAETNSQIAGSWGVPDRVKALVKKWSA